MPIYEYRCSSCESEHEIMRKISSPPLVDCPKCGKATLVKMISAAGFQLKGGGWYVTDFKDGKKGKDSDSPASIADSKGTSTNSGDSGEASKAAGGTTDS
jgi:putative FmdB family regulatory protein